MNSVLRMSVLAFAITGLSSNVGASSAYNGKAMALSGAGVASADHSYGVQINPANANNYDESDDFNINLNVGVVASDGDDLIKDSEDLADILSELDILNIETTVDDLQGIVSRLEKLDDSGARFAAGANLTVSIPNEILATVFFANTVVALEARTVVDDGDITAINALIEGAGADINVNDLKSSAQAIGVLLTEYGFSFAKEFEISNQAITIGISPKYQNFETIAYVANVANFDEDNFDADEYIIDDSNLNVDVGVSMHWDNWYVGAAIKNLIEEEYETVNAYITVDIETQATIGASYKSDTYMVSVDLDLNPIQYLGTQQDAQLFRIGAEIDLWNTVQLRLGYRHDLEGTLGDTASLGLGFSPFDVVNLDLSVLAGDDETYGAALQLGISF